VEAAARGLLGCHLVAGEVRLRLTEVEAYGGPEDSASHARHGRTPRNAPMWGPPGRLYLYLCYGMHWMVNVVTGPEGQASAVLVRGAEGVEGLEVVLARRGRTRPGKDLLNGPGKVAQALGLRGPCPGLDLLDPDSPLRLEPGEAPLACEASPRIGIAFAEPADQARPWRFVRKG